MKALLDEAARDGTIYLLGGVVLVLLLARTLRIEERRRLLVPVYLTVLHLLALPFVVLTRGEAAAHQVARLVALLAEAMAVIGWAGALLFARLLPPVGVRVSGILRDVVMVGASLVAGFTIAHREGFNLGGIIATSAVLTAVVGFSLQDVLGNVMGGLSLQLEGGFEAGDWVKVGEVSGRVKEIRWRHTAIETRNGDTVVYPNALIARSQITVLAHSEARAGRTRRWVWFNVDFRHPPTEVIAAVEEALASGSIAGVAAAPRADCVLMELGESYGRYAARYWLTDLHADDGTDSVIRTRIFYALSRAAVPLSIPAHAVFVTEDNVARRQRREGEALERRERLLAQVELFARFSEADRKDLAARMRPARFAAGEVVHRQGAEAHWLYVLAGGEIEERVAHDGIEEVVCRVRAPEIFGEMSLMTGSPRLATVVAATGIECFRLDKLDFERIKQLPQVVEHIAQVIARRRMDLDRASSQLEVEARSRKLEVAEKDIGDRIREFFGVEPDEPPGG